MGFQIVDTLTPQNLILTISGGLVPRGPFDESRVYIVGEAPSYEGKTYICWTSGTAGTLPTNTSYFQPIA